MPLVMVENGKATKYFSKRAGGSWQPIGSGWPAMGFNSEMAQVEIANQSRINHGCDIRAIAE